MTPTSSGHRLRPLCALAAAAALAAPGAARAYTRTFSAGSLIIPAQQEYQTDCGMTSAYGLIYSILYKNAGLVAAGKKPVTVYWIVEAKKLSHHRCNTDTDALPNFSRYNDNDGCDFAIQSATGQPVALLQNDNTELAPFSVFSTSYAANGTESRTTLNPATSVNSAKHVVKYSGGVWVIDASDRAAVLDMFKNDPLVSLFRTGDQNSCKNIPVSNNGNHYTVVHSARIGFIAPVARIMNKKPPLIALLDAGAVTLLQDYLRNAGLAGIAGAGGTTTTHGIIYDTLDPVRDFVSTPTYPYGALNMPDTTDPLSSFYKVMWAPHWVANIQSSVPGDGDPGDETIGDGRWTHYDSAAGTHDDPITNALKNIGYFADQGNGVFAECATIESLEGSYKEGATPTCSGNYQCECADNSAMPVCTFGDIQPLGCGSGYTAACGACYQCQAGYVLDTSGCDLSATTTTTSEARCVSTTTQCVSATDTWACGNCYSCDQGWSLDASSCSQVVCTKSNRKMAPHTGAVNTGVLSKLEACAPGYVKSCIPGSGAIDIDGNDATRFHATNRLAKNGLGNSFAGPDCTDSQVPASGKYHRAVTGDCYDFHPQTGGPGNIFAQMGNFNYTGTTGHIHQYLPPSSVGSYYRPGVLQFATSYNAGDTSRQGWDFSTARHKDGDPSKGMVVYLAGHSYQGDVAGNRIVLNTMLNLGFSPEGPEIARSEPVGYVLRHTDMLGNLVNDQSLVFQGTYVQRPPPGPFQDWLNYNAALPKSWRFPYIDGHLRAYDLANISQTKQAFDANALWDAAQRMPLPANRTIFTVQGGAAGYGWKSIEIRYTQTSPSTCTNADGNTDAAGQPLCDLSEALAACGTAGVTSASLQSGDSGGAKAAKLGEFVQQVRGFCAAHNSSGVPIYEPSDGQCDDRRQQPNRAQLGGIDHSSPAIVGPSRFIHDEQRPDGTTIQWSRRPVVAYVGARDGMLHAFYVSGDAWTAEGQSLAANTPGGKELWAFVPPHQLCGLATQSAMVDATVNVMDVFGDFPHDANGDGVADLADAAERPDGIREWRTVLVATSGEGGGEIFALDVTNPLHPVLLWHVDGARQNTAAWDANRNGTLTDAGDVFDAADPATWAPKWFDFDDGVASTAHISQTSDTNPPPMYTENKTGRFDYRNLGLAYGTAMGMLWEGNAYRYLVWVATSSANWTDATAPLGYKGVEVFAIDVVTGQKRWQWQHRYQVKNSADTIIADNAIPGRPALVDVDMDGSVDRVYVGDMEGRLWELSASDGRNLIRRKANDGKFWSLPLFGTEPMVATGLDTSITGFFQPAGSTALAQQPLTSPIGVGRLSTVPPDLEPYLKGRIAVTQGTMGVDWSIAPFQYGHVYVLPVYTEDGTRITDPVTLCTSAGCRDPRKFGVLGAGADGLTPVWWDITLDLGERVFGMPKIVGDDIFINTAYGAFTGDIADTYLEAGYTRKVNAGSATQIMAAGKAFGGVLVLGTDVIVSSASGIEKKPTSASPPTAPDPRVRNRATPAFFNTWEQLPDVDPAWLNP